MILNKGEGAPLFERWGQEGEIQVKDISQCFYCTHLNRNEKCNAFPKGIPEEILNNNFIHREEYPNDGGIRYSPMNEKYVNVKFSSLKK